MARKSPGNGAILESLLSTVHRPRQASLSGDRRQRVDAPRRKLHPANDQKHEGGGPINSSKEGQVIIILVKDTIDRPLDNTDRRTATRLERESLKGWAHRDDSTAK